LTGHSGLSSPITSSGTEAATYKTQYKVTFTQTGIDSSAGSNTVLTVGSTTYAYDALPSGVWVDSGTTFSWSSPVSGGSGKQFVKTGQSGTSPITASGTYSATYKTRYYLTVNTDPSGVNSPTGAGWYDTGVTAHVSTDNLVNIVSGSSRYRFDSWTGASGTYSDATVVMDSAKTATANYIVQYKLTVRIRKDPAGITTILGENWYDNCTWVPLTAPLENSVKYLFAYWDVDGASQGMWANSITVHMDAPHIATAVYKDYLGDAIEEINSLRTYVTRLNNKNIYSNFMSDSSKIVKDNIMKAIANLDTQRAGYDDKMKGFEGLRHATMKLNHMIKDENNWRRENKIPADAAAHIIGELENIRMKLVNKAKGEALAEKALALKAIENAFACGKDTTKALEEIGKVDNELNKAEQSILGGKLAQAIQHFKHAFAHSHNAIKKAYDPTWAINYKDWIDDLEVEDP
jgi:hypothetical protein